MPDTISAPEQLPLPTMMMLSMTVSIARSHGTIKVMKSFWDQEVKNMPAIISAPELLPLPTLMILSGTGRTALTNLASYSAASACRPAARRRRATHPTVAGLHARHC